MKQLDPLTEAQWRLLDHLRRDGKIVRQRNALPGRGYFAEGIRMLLPLTVQTLNQLGFIEDISDDEGEEQVFVWTGLEPEELGLYRDDLPVTSTEPEPAPVLKPQTREVVKPKTKKWRKENEDLAHRAKLHRERTAKRSKAPAALQGNREDILMWVGSATYRDIESVATEARAIGISKRVSRAPLRLVPGVTRLFLVHDEGFARRGVIFGYVVVEGVETIPADAAPHVDERGREREPGATYLVAYREQRDTHNATAAGPLLLLNQPINYTTVVRSNGRRFRGAMYVNGSQILDSTDYMPRPSADPSTGETPPELDQVAFSPTGKWSAGERDALIAMVASRSTKADAFREFARATGRSLLGVTYQWYNRLDPSAVERSAQK